MNTFSALVAAAVSGVLYDAQGGDIQAGFSIVCIVSVIVAAVGCLLTVLVIRPGYKNKQ